MLLTQEKHPLLFRYPGGKYYALNLLRPFWTSIPHDEYREPLVGGGSVFLNKQKVKYNWINDLDEELIKTYQVISNKRTRVSLNDLLSQEEASPKRWREVLNLIPQNKLDVAFKYYYLNRTSFSGKLQSAAWGYRPKRSLPPERWSERILPCGEKLENVNITSLDFEKVITASPVGENVLMFLDPPYFAPPKKKHYRNGFTLKDHVRMAECLKQCPYYFFLTYDDVPEIRKLYKWANITEVKFFYRVDNSNIFDGKRKLGFELIISNYDVNLDSFGKSDR